VIEQEDPRLASAADLEQVLGLAAKAGCQTSLDGVLDFEAWQTGNSLLVLGPERHPEAFLVLKRPTEHPITGDLESVILDYFAPQTAQQEALFDFAEETAREQEGQFLTIEIAPQQLQVLQTIEGQGYQLESYRISVATANCSPPDGSPYSVRLATEADDFSIAVLNSTVLPHTLSAGRDYDISQLTFRSMDATFQQLKRRDSQSLALVLVNDETLIGYLLLSLRQQSAYINDLAISPEHWGGKGVLHIMRAGSQLLFERNVPQLIGDVSASNLRALKIAQRYLGFKVFSRRYGLRL
jgi:hypothetical protein